MLKFIAFIASFFLTTQHAIADGSCTIKAHAVARFLTFEISGCKIKGDLKEKGGKMFGFFKVDPKLLDSGIKLRNEHMKKNYLEVGKYKSIDFKLYPLSKGADSFEGELALHGVTKKISGVVLDSGKHLKVNFDINTLDFGIKKAGYKGITIGESLNITAAVQ